MAAASNNSLSTTDFSDPKRFDTRTVERILNSTDSQLKGRFTLIKPADKRADCWRLFRHMCFDSVLLTQFTICSVCKQVYTHQTHNADTSGMKRHKCCSNSVLSQRTLFETQKTCIKLSDIEKKAIKGAQMSAVVEGHLSFRAMENDGLINLIQTCVDIAVKHQTKMDVKDALYGRMTVANELQLTAKRVQDILSQRLSEPARMGTVALTMDLTTESHTRRSYLDVHCIWEEDFQLISCPLYVNNFPPLRHTGPAIASETSAVLESYDLKLGEVPIVTDQGSNVVNAFGTSFRMPCFAHRLHTCHTDMVKHLINSDDNFRSYDETSRNLTTYFNQTSGLQERLPVSLKRGPLTRTWTAMYDRAASIDRSYEEALNLPRQRNHKDLVLSVRRDINSDVLNFTKFTKAVFEKLEADKVPTLQYVVPSYYALSQFCNNRENDSDLTSAMKEKFLELLDSKYWTSIKALHWLATYLDPSYKSFDFIPNSTADEKRFRRNLREDVFTWLKDELLRCCTVRREVDRKNNSTDDQVIDQTPSKSVRFDASVNPLDAMRSYSSNSPSPQPSANADEQSVLSEIEQYKGSSPAEPSVHAFNPLENFWCSRENQLPLLSMLARRIYVIPASSASSERDFSDLKLTISERRASLSPGTINCCEIVRGAIRSGIISSRTVI